MALKGIIYKIRCVETQRNIYYFKKQVAPNREMKCCKQNRTFSPLLSSFRKFYGQRPMSFRREGGVVSPGNKEVCLRMN